jgi:hypothetical protein
MDSLKIQFVYTCEKAAGYPNGIPHEVLDYIHRTVPNVYELNNAQVSAALSLDIAGLMHALGIDHPGNMVAFKHVEYERIKDHHHNSFKTKVSLKSEVFKILDLPVYDKNKIKFVGIEGDSDRIRSYNVTDHGRIQYILSNNISRIKPKKPLRLTG